MDDDALPGAASNCKHRHNFWFLAKVIPRSVHMNFLPKSSGARPRVACEISCQGVVAARSADAGSPLSAVAKVDLPLGAVVPSLKPGNIVDRLAVTTALRRVMEDIGARANTRGADISLIIPDTAVRVLLLDFDALSSKLSEALPIVRFRLKKLLPFDAEDAMITFQVMSTSRSLVRVLAVAIPRDVLTDYETAAREAGFEPGSVLPSTLATLPSAEDTEGPVLIVNANTLGVTTAIVRAGVLLLHRSVDLQDHDAPTPPNIPQEMFEPSLATLPLVDVETSASEWAAQEALPEHGRNPYADRTFDEEAVQNEDSITGMPVPPVFAVNDNKHLPATSVLQQTVLHPASPSASAEEIAQAVSVAAAYFEDTLSALPSRIFSAGPLGAADVGRILVEQGVAQQEGLSVRELVNSSALLSEAVTANVSRAWLAGVAGALRG